MNYIRVIKVCEWLTWKDIARIVKLEEMDFEFQSNMEFCSYDFESFERFLSDFKVSLKCINDLYLWESIRV